jgi:hypothetical protein
MALRPTQPPVQWVPGVLPGAITTTKEVKGNQMNMSQEKPHFQITALVSFLKSSKTVLYFVCFPSMLRAEIPHQVLEVSSNSS